MLKNIKKGLLVLCTIALISGCKKTTYEESLSEVRVSSVTMLDEENAEVTAEIINPGASAIEYAGICFDTHPNPYMETNQVRADQLNGNTFTVEVKLQPDSHYYFKAFATNYFGYSMSRDYEFVAPHPEPHTAPCTMAANRIKYSGATFTVPYVYEGPGNWGLYKVSGSASGGPEFEIEFNKKPGNGIYTTVGDPTEFEDDRNPKEVFVYSNDGWANHGSASSGGKVYVNENADGTYEVTFCDLLIKGTIGFSGRLTVTK
jgi:hypothetical protein